jgi:hypothetical protein
MSPFAAERLKIIINGGVLFGAVGVLIGIFYAIATGTTPVTVLYGGLFGWVLGVSVGAVASPEIFKQDLGALWRAFDDDDRILQRAAHLLSVEHEGRVRNTLIAMAFTYGACHYAWSGPGVPTVGMLLIAGLLLKLIAGGLRQAWGLFGYILGNLILPAFLAVTAVRYETNLVTAAALVALALLCAAGSVWQSCIRTRQTLKRAQAILLEQQTVLASM